MPRKENRMIKTNVVVTLGIAALTTLLAPAASAGCGKGLVSRLQVLTPENAPENQPRLNPALTGHEDTPEPASGIIRVAGLWSTSVSLGGQVIFQAFEAFTGDGLEFLNDNGSPLEGNVCFGTWTVTSRNTVGVYHPSWSYDANGNLIGTTVIKSSIAFDAAGNSFKGTVIVDTYDLNGKVAGPRLEAQLTGKRVTAN